MSSMRILSREFSDERNALESELDELNKSLDELTQNISQQRDKLSIIKDYMNIQELTFDFVNTCIDKIVIYEKQKYSREYNFEIFWNF